MITFRKVKLGDVCANITDGKHGDCQNEINSGYYFISSKDVFDGGIHYENARQITQADFIETHKRTRLETGDVLITNSGTIGRMAFIKSNERVGRTTFQKSVAIIKPNQREVDNAYLYYQLLSLYKQLVNLGGGSAQHNLLLGDLRNFSIQIPDLSTQKRIAFVLSAYDDLIENNEKRIKVLEEMAQLLYTEWFMKFKFPGHEKAKMADSGTEYGMIPEGWEVKTVEESFKILGGGTPSKIVPEYWGGEINWYTPTDLTGANEMFTDESSKKITEIGLQKSSAKLLPPFSIMMTSRATIGVISINTYPATTNQGFISCIPNGKMTLYYLYYWLKQHVPLFIDLGSGATFKEINKGNFKKIKILCPQFQILKNFETLSSPIMNLILRLQRENGRLSQMRDLLIPQLVTGKRALISPHL